MSLANLTLRREMKVRARAAAQRAKYYDPNTWPIAVCNGSYLDVDEILARSLPEVVGTQVTRVSERSSSEARVGRYSLRLQELTSE